MFIELLLIIQSSYFASTVLWVPLFFAKNDFVFCILFLNGPPYGLVPKLCEVHGRPEDGGHDTAERGPEGEPEEAEEGPESKTVRSTETTGRACLTRRTQGIL